ncbi:efflux RND transporter periplasmic adaptor subunit [Clostridium sp.]|uniref:efflux RND transporter periplasmic adaptor subunit n=1 Tax=Clostridium sp. TaxID=1506 RepID=UPI003D6D29EA
MKKKHIIFITIIVLIILTGIIAYVFKNSNSSAFNKNNPIALYTIPAKEKIFVNGVIVPEKSENIFLDETKGTVDKVSVTDEQLVKKGDTLFTYKNHLITDELDKANQQITTSNQQKDKLLNKQNEAESLLAKQKQKANNKATTPGVDKASIASSLTAGTEAQLSGYTDQIDAVETQIDASKNEVKNLKDKEFTNVKAPIDGKVILNDIKDMTKAYIVIESTTFYVKGSINEKDQIKVKKDQQVDILIFATNKTLTGKVESVGTSPVAAAAVDVAQSATGGGSAISSYDANILFDSQANLVNGFHVQATVKLKESDIKIPKTSILQEAGKQYVFKVVNKKLTKLAITYKNSTAKDVVVLSGLKENDRIAVTTKDMKEGISVE